MDNKKQLIHLKQLYLRAEKLTSKSDEVNLIMLSLLLDFVVESFLKLVIHTFPTPLNYPGSQRGYYYKINQLENERYKPNMDFYRAWDEVVGIVRDVKNGIGINDLPLRRDMDRLHEIRNDVQHKGSIPNSKELNKYVPLVESFLTDVYQAIFTVDFDNLSAVSLIQDAGIREKLEEAYNKLSVENWTEAVCDAAIAYDMLTRLMQQKAYRKKVTDDRIVLDQTSDGTFLDLTSNSQKQFNSNLLKEVERLKNHVTVIGFNMDYAEYVNIEPELPVVERFYYDENGTFRDEPKAIIPWGYSDQSDQIIWKDYTEEEAMSIVQFVEKQALELQI